MQPKVSVLMPSRNVQPYISRCLDSVVEQTLSDIEIICVDADSTDGTREVLQNYADKDSRIHILRDDKKSTGYANNKALHRAVGEYIAIVETDDYIESDMLATLYASAKDRDLDIAKGDFISFRDIHGRLFEVPKKLSLHPKDYTEVFNPRNDLTPFGWEMYTWAGIYRRSMLLTHDIRWQETPGASFQDIGFWFQTFAKAKRVGLLNKPLYHYRQDNPDASVKSSDHMAVGLAEFSHIRAIFADRGREGEWARFSPAFANELVRFSVMAYPCLSESMRVAYAKQVHELLSGIKLSMDDRRLFSSYNYGVFCRWQESAAVLAEFYQDEQLGLTDRQEQLVETIRNCSDTVIFSAGSHGVNIQIMLYEKFGVEVTAFADNAFGKQGTVCNGVPVFSPDEAVQRYPDAYFLIANKLHGQDIAVQLQDLGVLSEHMQVVPVEKLLDYFL